MLVYAHIDTTMYARLSGCVPECHNWIHYISHIIWTIRKDWRVFVGLLLTTLHCSFILQSLISIFCYHDHFGIRLTCCLPIRTDVLTADCRLDCCLLLQTLLQHYQTNNRYCMFYLCMYVYILDDDMTWFLFSSELIKDEKPSQFVVECLMTTTMIVKELVGFLLSVGPVRT